MRLPVEPTDRAGDRPLGRADGYFARLRSSFDRAATGSGSTAFRIPLGPRSLQVRIADPALAKTLPASFAGIEAAGPQDGREHEPRVFVLGEAGGEALPQPPWDPAELDGAAETTIRIGPDLWASWAPESRRLSVADRGRGEAVVHYRDGALSWSERAAPLRHALHWLVEARGLRLLHAAGVGAGGRGALLVGRSGAGKTTLALACLAHGLDYLGDDYVAVETVGAPRAHAIYATAKPSAETLRRVPGFEADVVVPPGSEAGQKAALGLLARHRSRLPTELGIVALVVPKLVAGAGGSVEPAPGSAAMLAMAPSTIIQHPARAGEPMAELAELARRVRCFSVEVGHDPRAAAAAIGELVRDV